MLGGKGGNVGTAPPAEEEEGIILYIIQNNYHQDVFQLVLLKLLLLRMERKSLR